MKVVTVCGRIRYKETIEQVERSLTNCGYIVFTPVMGEADLYTSEDHKKVLARAHRTKITMSNYVVAISPYGNDTKEEIDFALSMNKEVYIVDKVSKEVKKIGNPNLSESEERWETSSMVTEMIRRKVSSIMGELPIPTPLNYGTLAYTTEEAEFIRKVNTAKEIIASSVEEKFCHPTSENVSEIIKYIKEYKL